MRFKVFFGEGKRSIWLVCILLGIPLSGGLDY